LVNKNLIHFGNTFAQDKFRKLREECQNKGKQKAKELNWLHISGCMLFWGEGSKKKNSVILTNSDVNMLKFFLKFLMECYNVRIEEIKLEINAYDNNGMSISDIEAYWCNALCLPKSCLRKSIINKYSKFSSKKKKGKLLYGTCKIMVHRTDIVQNIYGAVQEYGDFRNEKWLY
jgi:hypothetical protein